MDPLYSKIKNDIEKKIKDGTYTPGQFIPCESELEAYYRVSRTTVRKAINELVLEGFLNIVRGVGTKVASSKLNSKGSELMSFTELMKRQGIEPGLKDMQVKIGRGDDMVTRMLEISPWEEYVEIYRVRTADGEPITTDLSYIPLSMVPGGDLSIFSASQSLYSILEEKCNLQIMTTEDEMSAVAASSRQAEILGINKNDPVLNIERKAYDKEGTVVEWSRIVIRGDRYKHIVTLRRR